MLPVSPQQVSQINLVPEYLGTLYLAGANIVNIQKAKTGDQPPDVVSIREIGGE